MSVEFSSPKEFREVMDRIFSMMDTDPDMGPKLRAADVPQRFEFSDVDMVVNIRAATEGGAATCTGSGPTTSTGSPGSR